MEESKIVRYIFAFSAKERDRFTQFVHSPFFNQHKPTRDLLRLITKAAGRKNKKLDKKTVFKKIYPDLAYDEQKIFNLLSNLKKLLNRYLAIIYLEDHPRLEELFTLETTFKKQQFDLLTNRARQLEKSLKKYTIQADHHYFINYRMHNLLGYYGGTYVNRSKSTNLQQMMDHLDRFYILEKLKNSCHLFAHYILMNVQYEYNLLDTVISYVEDNKPRFREDQSIQLYYTILMSLRDDENPSYYQRLKTMLNETIDQFSKVEQEDLYGFSYNYCIRRINRGDQEYQSELFSLYQKGLESGILIQNGIITEWNYKNIATLGAKLGHFQWTEDFINQHKEHLPANQRENAYSYNLAYLYYTKKMYDEVLSNLLHVQYTDVKYHLSSSFLLLRTYYAMRDTEALLSLIETFRIYVLRNRQMTSDQKKGYINFLRLVKKLVLLKHDYTVHRGKDLVEQLDRLRLQILDTENVINRSWLVEECSLESAATTE